MSAILKEPGIAYQKSTVGSKGYQLREERLNEDCWFKPNIGSDDYYVSRDINPAITRLIWKTQLYKPFLDKTKKSENTLEVSGEFFLMPVCLKHISDSIEEGKEILEYGYDWDDEGALATDSATFLKATQFIVQYTTYIYQNSSVILTKPYIDILRDGSVSVHWESGINRQLLIIFDKKEGQQAIFYAEQGDRKIPLKGAIIPGEAVDESLAVWMKNYLGQ